MRALCCDKDGLFFAGDTAQTISVGSSFSFNELKAFQYRLEVDIGPVAAEYERLILCFSTRKTQRSIIIWPRNMSRRRSNWPSIIDHTAALLTVHILSWN
jgi:hypothetical protein